MPSAKKIGRMVTADVDKALANIGSTKPEMKDDGAELKAAVAPKKAPTFAEAFKAARAEKGSGKTFTWGGKSYSTNMAGEGAKKAAPVTRRPAVAQQNNTSKNTAPPPPPPPSPPPPAAQRRNPPAAPQQKARPKDTVRTGRDILGDFFDTSAREKEIARGASKPRDYTADRARIKAANLAEKAARRKALGIREPGMAKGGKIDGCAVRGKTRAMRKGK